VQCIERDHGAVGDAEFAEQGLRRRDLIPIFDSWSGFDG
jgi:hypothetical protein